MAYQPKSYRKFVATAATATLVAGAIAPLASAASFTDVAPQYKDAVDFVVSKGAQGLTETKFGVNDNIKRVDAAVLLVKVLGLDIEKASASGFTDVPDRAVKYVNALKEAGITTGKTKTKFDSNALITRGELAIWIQRGFELKGEANSVFTDVAAQYTAAVGALVANEITKGKTATQFGTNDNAKRGDYAVFLKRAYDAKGDKVSPAVKGVKAINATTVEVEYKDNLPEDWKAADFIIEGLTVTNAVKKQGVDNTIVLTTSTQTGDTKYTVSYSKEKVGTFTGISAVIPSAAKITTNGVQGVVGKEVTLKAEVTVAEGQSKAGIPVTFNIDGAEGSLNKDIVKEVYTDDKGVATFTYTQYNAANDQVIVYPSGNASQRTFGVVYWGADTQLTVKSVKEAVNGKVVTTNESVVAYEGTVRVAKTGALQDGGYVYVNIAENLDSSVLNNQTVTVIDNNTGLQTVLSPSVKNVPVKVDPNGKVAFSIKGSNQEVTPVVWLEKTQSAPTTDFTNNANDITVTASAASFQPAQSGYTFTFDRTSQFEAPIDEKIAYKVTVKTADGKPYINSSIKVRLKEVFDNDNSTNTSAYLHDAVNGVVTLKTDANGIATFYVQSGLDTDHTVPQVWIDVEGGKNNNLDVNEPTADAPRVVFTKAQFTGFTYNSTNDKAYNKGVYALGKSAPKLEVTTINQNNNLINKLDVVTYVVTNKGAEATVTVDGKSKTLANNETYTVDVRSSGASTSTVSVSSDTATTLSINATAKTVDGTSKDLGAKELQFVSTTPIVSNDHRVEGTIAGFQTLDGSDNFGYVVVNTATGYKYYEYNHDNTYYVNGTASTPGQFERALTVGETLVLESGAKILKLTHTDALVPSQESGNIVANKIEKTIVDQEAVVNQGLQFTASQVAKSNKNLDLRFTGTPSTSAADIATVAVSSEGKLEVTPKKAGEATVTVNVTDGVVTEAVSFKVNVKEQGEQKLTLDKLPAGSYEITKEDVLNVWKVSVIVDKLPADLQGAKGYEIKVDGTTYTLRKNKFDAKRFLVEVPLTVAKNAVETAEIKAIK